MKITMNKDFLEYKDDVLKGFSMREVIFILVAMIEVCGLAYLLYRYYGISINTSIYIGIFTLAAPTIIGGLYKYQGMYVWSFGRELYYQIKTQVLVREMEECVPEMKEFTMVHGSDSGLKEKVLSVKEIGKYKRVYRNSVRKVKKRKGDEDVKCQQLVWPSEIENKTNLQNT